MSPNLNSKSGQNKFEKHKLSTGAEENVQKRETLL